VAAAAVVASGALTRMSLETARQSAEDRATAAQIATAAAATERDSLASRLALTEAEVEKLRAATTSAEEATERARTTAAATETATQDVAQAAAREKATLEVRVSELEHDLGTATTDLVTADRQFSQVSTSFRWSPRRRHGYARGLPSCQRTSRVSRVVAFFLQLPRCSFLAVF
jgi:chromosome segregation ATPase